MPDYGSRLKSNNKSRHNNDPEAVEDSLASLPRLSEYGFKKDNFVSQAVYSKKQKKNKDGKMEVDGDGRPVYIEDEEPILEMSHARKKHNGVDREVIVAHQRYATKDRNRYDLDYEGNHINVDERGDPIPRNGWKDNSVPVYQMMHESLKVRLPDNFSLSPRKPKTTLTSGSTLNTTVKTLPTSSTSSRRM
jgi:hypothetical protein